MSDLIAQSASVFRDWTTDGVPSPNTEWDPKKADIRALMASIITSAQAVAAAGGATVFKASQSDLNADLAHVADTVALVYQDATEANNDFYLKSGSSGSGSWSALGLTIPASMATQIATLASAYAAIDAQVASASVSASTSTMQAAISTTKASESQSYASAAATQAMLLTGAVGLYKIYNTYAEAAADLSSMPANGYVQILNDENSGAAPAYYQKQSGSLVLVLKPGIRDVRPEYFGATADNVADDSSAFAGALAWITSYGGNLMLSGGKTYYVASLLDLSGVTVRNEHGAAIRGDVDLSKTNLATPDDFIVHVDSAGVKYDYPMPRGFGKPFSEKSLWLSEGDMVRDAYNRLNPSEFSFEKISWPSSDTWLTDTLAIASGEVIDWNLTMGGIWHAALRPARGGHEMRCSFSKGAYTKAVLIRHNGGYIIFYATDTAALTCAVKDIGVAANEFSIAYDGLADHPQWLPDNSEWGIRLYDNQTYALVINGTEVYRASVPGIITEYGFAVYASAGAIDVQASYFTERTSSLFGGQIARNLMIYGDSISAPFFGAWFDALRETLDGSYGLRINSIDNQAVPGYNSGSVLDTMNSHGLGIANYIIIFCGTNDVQGGSPLSTSISDLETMLDTVNSAGRKAVVCIPPLWLNADQTPDGFATANAEKGAPLRTAYRNMAANKNALIVDMQELTGQILSTLMTAPDISDGRLRDRIHPRPFLYRLFGQMIARVIAADICRKATRALPEITVPPDWFANGWTGTSDTPWLSVNSDGLVQFRGVLDAGTKTDGTIIMNVPLAFAPKNSGYHRFLSYKSSGGICLLQIGANGELSVYGLGSDTYLTLDGITYQA